MKTQITQIMPDDKKVWENPTLVVIDSNDVNSGAVNSQHEITTPVSLATSANHS